MHIESKTFDFVKLVGGFDFPKIILTHPDI